MHQDCVFCKIISGQIPSKKIQETDDLIVLQDIAPKAPVHYLIVPKKHIKNLQACLPEDQALLGSMLLMTQTLSKQLSGNQEFKLVSNNGASVGQSVFHLHMHFLAGGGKFIQDASV